MELVEGDVDFCWSGRRCFSELWRNYVALSGIVEEDRLGYQYRAESSFSAVSLDVVFEWKKSFQGPEEELELLEPIYGALAGRN